MHSDGSVVLEKKRVVEWRVVICIEVVRETERKTAGLSEGGRPEDYVVGRHFRMRHFCV